MTTVHNYHNVQIFPFLGSAGTLPTKGGSNPAPNDGNIRAVSVESSLIIASVSADHKTMRVVDLLILPSTDKLAKNWKVHDSGCAVLLLLIQATVERSIKGFSCAHPKITELNIAKGTTDPGVDCFNQ